MVLPVNWVPSMKMHPKVSTQKVQQPEMRAVQYVVVMVLLTAVLPA